MNTLSIPVLIIASISFYVGCYHLLIYFRRRQYRENLAFAFLCFSAVFYDAFCIGLYNAASVAEGVQWQRAQFISLAVFVPVFLCFVADYFHQKPGWVIYAFSIYYVLVIVVQLLDRSGLTFLVDQPSIKQITLSNVFKITYFEVTPGPFSVVQGLVGVVASTYILVRAIRYARRGHKKEAMPLILAIGFMYAAGLHDTLVSNGVYHFVYAIEYAYLTLILFMAYSLSSTVVEAAIAREALRKSEERFRSLVETTSDWVWEVDQDSRYTYSSPKVRDLLGYEPEEILGKRPFDLMPPEEAERIGALFRDRAKREQPMDRLENHTFHKDGRLVVMETNGMPLFDTGGKLLGYRGIDRDITERKLAEDLLRESEYRFRMLAEASFEGIALTKQGIILDLNEQLAQMLGFPRDELLGIPVTNCVAPEHRELVAGFIRSGRLEPYEHLALRKDGTVFPVEISVRTTSLDNRGVRITVIRDVTTRKQVEAALRESVEKYRSLFESSPEAVILLDLDGTILDCNEAAIQLAGRPKSEINGKKFQEIGVLSETELPRCLSLFGQLIAGQDVAPLQLQAVRFDKESRWLEIFSALLKKDGAVHAIQIIARDITERKQAEDALLQLSRKDEQALAIAQMGHWEFDIPSGLFTFNDQYYTLHGTTAREMGGYQMTAEEFARRLVYPEDAYTVGESIQRAVVSPDPGYQARFEGRIVRTDGEPRWVTVWFRVSKDAQGNTVKLYGVNQDITERKLVEQALRQAKVMVENSPAVLFRWKAAEGWPVEFVSQNVTQFGYEPQQLLSGAVTYASMIHPDDLERVAHEVRMYSDSGVDRFQQEYRLVAADGRVCWADDRSVIMRDAAGNITHFEGIIMDISARKRAEEALQQRAGQLATMNIIGRAVSTLQDLDSVLELIFRQVQRVILVDVFYVGLYDSENGRVIFPIIYDSEVRYAEQAAPLAELPWQAGVIRTGKPFILHRTAEELGSPPGRGLGDVNRKSASILIVPLWRGERVTGILSTQSYILNAYTDEDADILTGVGYQAAIAIENAQLYERAQQEIEERRRVQAEREQLIAELEAKNAELERFTYTVSHDLKAPLITIRGFLGFVEEDASSGNLDRLKSDIQRINDATDRMQLLLNELLELSRVGYMLNPPEEVAFGDLVQSALSNVQGGLDAARASVAVQPDLPRVFGDRQRLLEVLQNLLDNAAKFMGDQPSPLIEVGTNGNDSAGWPVFFVRDNGIGIAPIYHERIFGLFNKLDARSSGTGVGLTLVKRIIDVHGGRIWIESEPGKGTTFYFTLPPAGQDTPAS